MLFMQARSPSTWFMDRGIQKMKWPALSPDSNPVENIWAILSHSVYANGKQYDNVTDLKTAIFQARDNVAFDTIADLVLSMPDCIFKAILYHGKAIGY